jgi:hypothetical protein
VKESHLKNEPQNAVKVNTPPASDTILLASVMAVVWAIITTAVWALLAMGLGHSRGNVRLITMLVIGAVTVAFLCGHTYRHGWKSRRR